MGDETRRVNVLFAVGDESAAESRELFAGLLRDLPRNRYELHCVGPTTLLGELPEDVALHAASSLRASGLVPDLLCAAALDLPELADCVPSATPIVACVAGPASRRESWLAARRRRALYKRAAWFICTSELEQQVLHEAQQVPLDRISTIYDSIDAEALRELASRGPSPFAARGLGPHLVSRGTLAPERGYDRILDALPRLAEGFAGAELWILGDDPSPGQAQAAALRERADALGVLERLHLTGAPDNPYRWLHHADLFVEASDDASLPRPLLEALACGCPVVALESASSRELLHAVGRPEACVTQLDWPREWFRGAGGDARDDAPVDLTRFSRAAALRAFDAIFSQFRAQIS